MTTLPTARGYRLWLLLAIATCLSLWGLGSRDIVTSHEARVVQSARAMAASGWAWNATPVWVPRVALVEVNGMKRLRPETMPAGIPPLASASAPASAPVEADSPQDRHRADMPVNPWLVPVINGQIRLQKPPLPYWVVAATYRLFGYSEWTSRLGGAVLGSLSILFVARLGTLLYGRSAGYFAALAWLSLYFVYDEHRKAMADPYLAFFTLTSVWAWVRMCRRQEAAAASNNRSAVGGLSDAFLVYLSLALGALAKGPVIFLPVSAAVVAFHLCLGQRFRCRLWHHLAGGALFLAMTLPWPLYVMRHVPHALELWRYESVGEFADNTEKARPFYFYLPSLLQIMMPWTILVAFQAVRAIGRWRHDRMSAAGTPARGWPDRLFPLAWLAITVLGFSFSNVKKNAYLLPVMPAVALSAGLGFRRLVAALHRRPRRPLADVLAYGLFAAGIGVALFAPVGSNVGAALTASVAGWELVALLFAGVIPLTALLRSPKNRWPLAQAVALAVAIAMFFNLFNAPSEDSRSAKRVGLKATELLSQGDWRLAWDRLAEEATIYLPLPQEPRLQSDTESEKTDGRRVLLIKDDRDAVSARRPRQAATEFNPIGWTAGGGVVTAFERLDVPGEPRDAAWKLYGLVVRRQGQSIAKESSQ